MLDQLISAADSPDRRDAARGGGRVRHRADRADAGALARSAQQPHAGDGRPSATACAPRGSRISPRRKARAASGRRPRASCRRSSTSCNLRSVFDSEEVRDKLKMAGLRGQAPLVTYMFFRVVDAADHRRGGLPLPVRDRRLRLSRAGQDRPVHRRRLLRLLRAEHVRREPGAAAPDLDQERLPRLPRHAADLRAVGHVGGSRLRQGRPRRWAPSRWNSPRS